MNMKNVFRNLLVCLFLVFCGWKLYPIVHTYIKRNQLISTFEQMYKMDEMKIYDDLYTPEEKSQISREEYQKRLSAQIKPKFNSNEIVAVNVQENSGSVKAKMNYCFKEKCNGDEKQIIGDTWFLYQNGKWFLDVNHKQCMRTEPYNMPEEFNRAVGLIIQRFKGSIRAEDQEFGKYFSDARNCFDIQYAKDDSEMSGAEGLFQFRDDSPRDHLTILVSPRYKYKDDITTSLILVHELYHAMLRGSGQDIFYSCLDNEAYAYTIGYSYYFMLNQDEQNSLLARYEKGTSSELSNYFDTNKQILNIKGNDLAQKFKDYVKQSAYYQEQCGKY